MGQDVSKQLSFGPSNILIGGVDRGHTDESGVKVSLKNSYVRGKANKYGSAPVNILGVGQEVMVEFNLIQTVFADLAVVLSQANYVSSSTGKLTFGNVSGKTITPVALKVTPQIAALTPVWDFTINKAVSVGDPELLYTGDKYQVWKCKFEGVIDESQSDGTYLAQFGDVSISVAAGAPSASLTTPAGVTGVAIGTAIVWTFNKELRGATVTADTFKLFRASTGAAVACSAPVLVNNGASTTVTLTPLANLTAGTIQYLAFYNTEVTDQAGTPAVFKSVSFTTA